MPPKRKSRYSRPAPIDEDQRGKFYKVNRIVNEKEAVDGSILYLVDWEGYSPAERTWEPRGSFDDWPGVLEAWFLQGGSRAAVRRDLECIVSEAPQGYFVKLFNKPAEEAEWYPSSLISAELLEEWQAREAQVEDVEMEDAEDNTEDVQQQQQDGHDVQSKKDDNLELQLQTLEDIRVLEQQQNEVALSALRSQSKQLQTQMSNMQTGAEQSNDRVSVLQAENEQLRQQLLMLQQHQAYPAQAPNVSNPCPHHHSHPMSSTPSANTPQATNSTATLTCAAIDDTTHPHDYPYHCEDPQHQADKPLVSYEDCLNGTMINATDDQYFISTLGALVRLCSDCYSIRLENGYFLHQCRCFEIKRCPSCTLTWLDAMLAKNAEIKEVSQEFTVCCQCKGPVQDFEKLAMCGICKGWKERA